MSKKAKRKVKFRLNPFFVLCIILLITTIIGIMACIVISQKKTAQNLILESELEKALYDNKTMSESLNKVYTSAQMETLIKSASENAALQKENEIKAKIKSNMSSQDANTTSLLRSLFPENVIYKSSTGYAFAVIDDSIPKNNIDNSFLILDEETKEIKYMPNGELKSLMGIDVSQHQGEIDWSKVKEFGIDYAMIRVGIRGYGTGALVLDEQFENNIKAATQEGIKVGVYFFSQATSEDEIRQELSFVLNAIKDYDISFPVAIDIEKINDSKARGNLISKEDRTNYVDIFCKGITEAGYTPMIYGNLFTFFDMLDMSKLCQYECWFAFYDSYLYYPYLINSWQYTDSMSIPGISTKVDANITFK